jgi:hypothetical protein
LQQRRSGVVYAAGDWGTIECHSSGWQKGTYPPASAHPSPLVPHPTQHSPPKPDRQPPHSYAKQILALFPFPLACTNIQVRCA